MSIHRKTVGLRLILAGVMLVFVATIVGFAATRPVGAATRVPPAQTIVTVASFSFTPITTTISAGESVQWQHIEGFHNVDADDASFTSGPPSTSWGPYNRTFDLPGVYRYHCDVHGAAGGVGMSGVIVVEGELRRIYLPVTLKT